MRDDNSNDNQNTSTDRSQERRVPDFLWENTQSMKSKSYRDNVKAYSHLPNGISILDSKWVLGRVLSQQSKILKEQEDDKMQQQQTTKRDDANDDDSLLATLETHCFRGLDGFERSLDIPTCNSLPDGENCIPQLLNISITGQSCMKIRK